MKDVFRRGSSPKVDNFHLEDFKRKEESPIEAAGKMN